MTFDHSYYKRFYYDAKTAVTTKREMQARARLIAAYALHTSLPVRRVLDAGCGTGLLKPWLRRYLPRATYTGIESSEYLCARYGWQRAQIETYKASAPFDIVVCYDVMQYLDSDAAERGIANFGKLCGGVLYFTALTRVDWDHNCDQSRTDSNVHLRSALWYRSRLRQHFRESGCGFWLRRGAPFTVWDLEAF